MCRRGFVWCAVILSGAAGRGPAEGPARSVLNRAIEAQGGAAALARFQGFAYSQAGTAFAPGGATRAASAKVAYQLPDKLRYEGRTPDGAPLVTVFDGARGWVKTGDRTDEMKPGRVTASKELMYLLQVTSLAPLRDPIYTLTDLGDSTVRGRKVAGIKVARAGHPDVNLYFDRDSGLLYRLTTRFTDPQSGGQQDREEVTWDYRDAGGMKLAMYFMVWQNDKPVVEMKLSDVKCAEKLDDHLFTKP
jgi:outer membrane lipoprotein-sorting protein